MKLKKIMAVAASVALMTASLAGCSSNQQPDTQEDTSGVEENASNQEGVQNQEDVGEGAGADANAPADMVSSSDTFIQPAYAETEYGWLFGYKHDSTYIFKGIQYGVVAERFHSAVKPESWQGIRSALTYAETAPNTSTTVSVSSFVDNVDSDMVQNEQCLYLNVWTQSLEASAKKPVIFFIHGGGFSAGASNELATYDGKNISEFGDVVYVNVNHRLNYLGYTDLSAYGDEYDISGDVGMQDLVMALEWVRDNIENFGGDPSNVTIVGQSGGAAKVALLMQTPAAADLFSRAMMCSGTGMSMMGATMSFGTDIEAAQAAGKALVEKCKATYGLSSDEEALETLETISYEELAALAADTGVANAPTVGGSYIPEIYSEETGWPEIAKDKALIVSNTFGELAGNDGVLVMPIVINMGLGQTFDPENPDAFLANYYKPDLTEEDMVNLVRARFGDHADQIMELFAAGYPSRDVMDVISLNISRQSSTDMCIDKAKQGGAAVYNCVFAYEYPIMGGIMNYHTGGDLPFLFYNLDTRDYMIQGDEETAYKVAKEAATALINFAYTGDPSSDSLQWPAFTEEDGATMIFDDTSVVINYPDQELLQIINEANAAAGGAGWN